MASAHGLLPWLFCPLPLPHHCCFAARGSAPPVACSAIAGPTALAQHNNPPIALWVGVIPPGVKGVLLDLPQQDAESISHLVCWLVSETDVAWCHAEPRDAALLTKPTRSSCRRACLDSKKAQRNISRTNLNSISTRWMFQNSCNLVPKHADFRKVGNQFR